MAYNQWPYQSNYFGQTPYQMPQTIQPSQTGIIWVRSVQEADAYPVAPNNAVALWVDTPSPVLYMKKADVSGRPSVTVYDLMERTQKPEAPKVAYATKEDLEALKVEIEKLKKVEAES